MATTQQLVVVTGFRELDAKLRTMPAKLQKKFVRGALKKGGKRLTRAIRWILRAEAYDTGALYKAVQVKPLKARKDRIGIAVMPSRSRLLSVRAKLEQKARKKAGNATFATPNMDYYPQFVEYGTQHMPAVRPFRRALYDNAEAYRAYFAGDLKQFITEQKVDLKLPKAP